jgi:[Skp1-protein]-hydroxyproline N-acetylglucosaminyltransferase
MTIVRSQKRRGAPAFPSIGFPGNKGSKLVVSALAVLGVSYIIFGVVAVKIVFAPSKSNSELVFSGRRALRHTTSLPQNVINHVQAKAIQELQKNFPIHTHDNRHDDNAWEDILHPGIAFSGMERIKSLLPEKANQISETIRVPKFWSPPEYGPDGVRAFLGDNGHRYMTRDEADLIGSTDPVSGQETIFVSIASYRDSECTLTLESIYARAKYPDRIRVAVVDQIDVESPEDVPCGQPYVSSCDNDPTQTLCQYAHLIDIYQAPAFLMVGPVFARHIGHRMYRVESYALQVDAHVRFIQDWDEDIIRQWKSTHNEMAVLSTYLTDIDGSIDPTTHQSLRQDRNILCQIQYDGAGVQRRLTLKQPTKQKEPTVNGSPLLHPFWSAGFSFSRGHFLVLVPYDQYLPMMFQGEEAAIAVRGFTYGYDSYAPERSVAFHIYAIKENVGRKSRHKFWENEILFKGALEKSTARLNGITGLVTHERKSPHAEPYFTAEQDKYGLGRVRTKEQYFQTFGIHPDLETVDNGLCGFVNEDMHLKLTPFLRSNGIGIDYNRIKLPLH